MVRKGVDVLKRWHAAQVSMRASRLQYDVKLIVQMFLETLAVPRELQQHTVRLLSYVDSILSSNVPGMIQPPCLTICMPKSVIHAHGLPSALFLHHSALFSSLLMEVSGLACCCLTCVHHNGKHNVVQCISTGSTRPSSGY